VTSAEAAEADRLIVELLREAEEKIERRSRLQAMGDEDSVGDGPRFTDSHRSIDRAGAPRGVTVPSACGVGIRKKR
jgi:hypothetical protein